MEKSEAIERLRKQLDSISTAAYGTSAEKKWKRDTEIVIQKVFGTDSRHIKDFTRIRYSPGSYSMTNPEPAWRAAHQRGLESAKAVLSSMIEEVEEYGIEDAGSVSSNAISVLSQIEHLCKRFHLVAQQLRSRHKDRTTLEIEDEYDVQDLMHALLRTDFEDIRPEEWTPSYAGKSARVDFLLKEYSIVIEVKKTRKGLASKEVGDQLIIDIARYKVHPECKQLICFVYDPEGRVGNPASIENDLNGKHNDLEVLVIIAPRGL